MTIPMPGVNTTPQLVQPQGPGGIEQLLQVLQFRTLAKQKDREFAAAQAAEAFKLKTDAEVGNVSANLVTELSRPDEFRTLNIPSLPGMPGQALPTPGISTRLQVNTTPERLQRVLANQPGRVLEPVLRTNANLISQTIARDKKRADDAEAAKAKTNEPVKRDTEVRAMGGFWQNVDLQTGRSTNILDANNQPIPVDKPPPAKENLELLYDEQEGGMVWMTPRAGPLPSRYSKTGTFQEPELRGAALYRRMPTVLKMALTAEPMPADIGTQLLTAEGNGQGGEKFVTWIRRTKLPESTRKTLFAWEQVLSSPLYSVTGAAITVGEVLRELNGIPTTADDNAFQQSKYAALLDKVAAVELTGRRVLNAARAGGKVIPTVEDIQNEIVAENVARGKGALTEEMARRALADPQYAAYLRSQKLWQ